MNFTAVRGYNAYAQFSAKIREAVKSRTEPPSRHGTERDYSHSIYSEPIDIVSISETARDASEALTAAQDGPAAPSLWQAGRESPAALRENPSHAEFREWARRTGIMRGGFTQKIPGSVMNYAISGSGISVRDNEEFTLSIDVLSAVTVSCRNAEKARAIQNLMNSTPSGINWGMLLMKLPPR